MDKITEADLNYEGSMYGSQYVKELYKGADKVIENTALNAAAHGFVAGVRWLEEQYGLHGMAQGHPVEGNGVCSESGD